MDTADNDDDGEQSVQWIVVVGGRQRAVLHPGFARRPLLTSSVAATFFTRSSTMQRAALPSTSVFIAEKTYRKHMQNRPRRFSLVARLF